MIEFVIINKKLKKRLKFFKDIFIFQDKWVKNKE